MTTVVLNREHRFSTLANRRRMAFEVRCAILALGAAVCGCGWSATPSTPSGPPDVDRLARSAEPAELSQQIHAGEAANGGPQAQALLRSAYWLKRGDFQAALRDVATVAPDGRHRHTALWIAGEALFRSGDLQQSLRILNQLAIEAPDFLECRRCLAALYFDISAMDQAEVELLEVIRLAPQDFRPHHLLGQIHLDFEKFGTAIAHFRTALTLCPPTGPRLELQRRLATALRGDRRYEELLSTVGADENDPLLQTCRADALWSTGQTAEARRLVEATLQRAPDLDEALLLLARLDLEEGRLDRAADQLQPLLARQPHNVKARYQLALVQRQGGHLDAFRETMRLRDESQALIDRLVELNKQVVGNPGEPSLCREIAEVCDQLGKRELAASWRKAALAFRGNSTGSLPQQDPKARSVEPQERARHRHGYVGPDACARCHAEWVASCRETRHFQACVVPRPEIMPAGFAPGKGMFVPKDSPVRFEMSQSARGFQQTAIQQSPSGEQRTESLISLVYGSGAETDEVYFTWQGNQLSELPMCWLHPHGEWATASFDRAGNGSFSRPTTPRCMECHNTWMEHAAGTLNEYRRDDFVLGVTCETCHGPGREHVTYHDAHPDAREGQAVVHPGRLSRALSMDLCASCHSNALKHRGPAFSYRPGEPLEKHFKTLTTKHPEDDHVANQVTYLQASQCFQQSDAMTCVTCHNPHQATNLRERGKGTSACLKCHQPVDCRARGELPNGVQDNCVGCHMPRGTKIQVSFDTADVPFESPVARWEHRIGVYPTARDEVLLAWHQGQADDHSRAEVARLTQSLSARWLADAEQYRQDDRYLAAMHAYRQAQRWQPTAAIRAKLDDVVAIHASLQSDSTKLLHQMERQEFDDAQATAQRILVLKPNDAKARGRLGTVLAVKGQLDLAVEHWQAVAAADPDDAYGESMLGWQAYLQGRYAESLQAYQRAEDIEPYFDKIQYHMGLALEKLERWPDAIMRFQTGLTINPLHTDARLHLNSALRQTGQFDEALRVAQTGVNLTREEHLDLLMALADTYAEMAHYPAAVTIAEKMRVLAQSRNPQQLPAITQRLANWSRRAAPTAQ